MTTVAALILLSPIAIGSVHPWAFSCVEVVIFALLAAWMAKVELYSRAISYPASFNLDGFLPLAIPAGLFLLMVSLQLLPIPARLVAVLSPSTQEFYAHSLPGWPARFVTIALTPSLTRTALLKATAYSGLFFLVVFYPFGEVRQSENGQRLHRVLLAAILISATVVAVLGLAERAHWNGKILWCFVPHDWGVPQTFSPPRASGPFVNPDHFANYLATSLPIALVLAMTPSALVSRRRQGVVQIASAGAVLVLVCAILLSLSRGGWIGAGVALIGVFLMMFSNTELESSILHARFRLQPLRVLVVASIAGIAMIVSALMFVGETARMQADTRLGETVTVGLSLWERLSTWNDTLSMIRAFPLLGIGLGGYSEIFARFLTPPWYEGFYREAHNDYLQLLAEVGIVGFALATWFFLRAATILRRASTRVTAANWPLFAAVAAAIAVMAFHELVDFSLRIPANALLFVVLLAIGVRMVLAPEPLRMLPNPRSTEKHNGRTSRPVHLIAGSVAVGSVLLAIAATRQSGLSYPYDIAAPATLAQAREILSAHPASSYAHLNVVALGDSVLPREEKLQLLEAATWLAPTDPYARDLYAVELLRQGQQNHGLVEIRLSIAHAPYLTAHSFLRPALIPWLTVPVQRAIEQGLKDAVATGDSGAVASLASLYGDLGDFSRQASLYENLAHNTSDPSRKCNLLLDAGRALIEAGDASRGERQFHAAATVSPQNADPYVELARLFLRQQNLAAAKAAIDSGIKAGADPFELSNSLAEIYEKAGDWRGRAAALKQAARYRPADLPTVLNLGDAYMRLSEYGRATLSFERAQEIDPRSAVVAYRLAVAEDRDYQYSAADRDYARAVQLDPGDVEARRSYDQFKQRVAAAMTPN